MGFFGPDHRRLSGGAPDRLGRVRLRELYDRRSDLGFDRFDVDDYQWSNFATLTRYWGQSDWGYDGSAALSYSYDRNVSNNDQSSIAGGSTSAVNETMTRAMALASDP